jgi:purine-nucleoside phosphorylase
MTVAPKALSPAAHETASLLAARGVTGPFDLAMVLGTGLGPLADHVQDAVRIPYADIPHFPRKSGVSGHAAMLVAGTLEGRHVVLLNGRAHYYESGDASVMRGAIEALAAMGARRLLLTNACGSLTPEIRPGALVALHDHISWSGMSPLFGEPSDARFVPLNDAYDPAMRGALATAAAAAGVALREGIYVWYPGPNFETPAEIRAARILGGDLIGMSTVPEVILARRFGLVTGCVSMVTNLAAGIEGAAPSHTETKEVAHQAAGNLQTLVSRFVKDLPHG